MAESPFSALAGRLPPMMKQRLPLLALAVIVMGVTGAMIRSYLADREREIEQRYRKKYQAFVTERATVVVAVQDIPADTVLKPEMFEQTEVPVPYLQPYTLAQVSELVGKRATAKIAKGEQVMETKLAAIGSGTELSTQTPSGHRAVTLAQGSFASIPDSMKPGDRVDIMWTFSVPQASGGSQPVTATLFQHILVLGAGSSTPLGGGANAAEAVARSGVPGSTLTLALTPSESELMFFAQALGGRLYLILRPPTDKEIVQVPPTSGDVLLGLLLPGAAQARSQKPTPPTPPRSVEIFHGLEKQVVTFSATESPAMTAPAPALGVLSQGDMGNNTPEQAAMTLTTP